MSIIPMSTKKKAPFVYGITVSEGAFTNREKEKEKLFSNLTQGTNTIIISPRRWGKSSLVERVVREINAEGANIRTVVIDLFSVNSKEEFLELYAREVIKASSNKFEEWVQTSKGFLKHLVPRISVGVDPLNDFSIAFDWQELKKHEDEILNLPEAMATKKNVRFIICLDEFQNIANFTGYEAFEKKMRAVWQRQKRTTYCLYGSKRHMMSELFNQPSRPFYRFGDLMNLQKIERSHWVSFIMDGFKLTGKGIDEETAGLIPDLMKNHSWYVQQLANYAWNKTKTKCTEETVISAMQELIGANTPFYQRVIEGLSATQVNLLKAVAQGERQLTGASVMHTYRLGTPRNVSKNKTALINQDIISVTSAGFEFLDPAFEKWFRMHFLR